MAVISDLMKVHKVIDELFFEHQRALLHFDFEKALRILIAYESTLLNHMADEENILLPVYEERADFPAAGAPNSSMTITPRCVRTLSYSNKRQAKCRPNLSWTAYCFSFWIAKRFTFAFAAITTGVRPIFFIQCLTDCYPIKRSMKCLTA
ncbi:MAG: hemerythrin domain-containing protein [Acidobacteria bacterium]|nr:hemerythrin domain-containing protein [Acidobacteriota bacterium]